MQPSPPRATNIIKSTITETITLNAEGINLTLQDANISVSGKDAPAINITGGSTVITVEGTNNKLASSQWGGITMSGNASLTIQGNGTDKSNLTVTAGDNDSYASSTVGIGSADNSTCGNIKIDRVSLTVSGGNSWQYGAAAIGTSAINSQCGDIVVINSSVKAAGANGAAAIGLGYSYRESYVKCGKIDISSSLIEATIKDDCGDGIYGACIGLCIERSYVSYECGFITITCDNESDFLSNLKYNPSEWTDLNYKIGRGFRPSNNTPASLVFTGGTFNGKSFTDGYGKW